MALQTYSGLSISSVGFAFRLALGAGWWFLLLVEGETASGIFCLLDRRPEDPEGGNASLGLFSAASPFRLREDGVVEGTVGTSAAAGAILLVWAT